MNIGIVGYGKMGKKIEEFCKLKKIPVNSIIDPFSPEASFKTVNSQSLKGVDCVIEFANVEGLNERLDQYIAAGVNVVLATTGWYDRIEEFKKKAGNKIGLIWSGNFAIGVNLYFRIVQKAAAFFNPFKNYDTLAYEIHHKEKKDSPSGTALMIGNYLKNELDNKEKIVTERLDRKIEENELHIASVRGGYTPGIHVVQFDSMEDTVEIRHTSRSRDGFASGAILAAEWINKRKGFFGIEEMIDDVLAAK